MQALGLTESSQVRADADAESAVKARNHFILQLLEDLFIYGGMLTDQLQRYD